METLLSEAALVAAAEGLPRATVVACVREAVEAARQQVLEAAERTIADDAEALREAVLADALGRLAASAQPHYRRVVNATGVILHTALGRAVLPQRAIAQIAAELGGYSLLQADLATGARSRRDAKIEELLRRLTGAEAATVVNNNAAATGIVLAALAAGREVMVSRGQLVEIGGSFRLPDVMAASGAKLVEVGTTNKTHPRDYEGAIGEATAAILRVHPSNFRITGFTSEVPLEELVRIGRAHGVPVIDDLGAGALVDTSQFGFEKEPTVPESIRTGADLVTSSADKLIGGPQGGLIMGRADLVERVRRHPMARMVRVDKLTLAALEATLSLFLDEARARAEVPTLRLLARCPEGLAAAAERIATAVRGATEAEVEIIEGFSQAGSGSLPGQQLPTRLVAVAAPAAGPDALALRLRRHCPPVFARVHKGRLVADPRTLLDSDEATLIEALIAALR